VTKIPISVTLLKTILKTIYSFENSFENYFHLSGDSNISLIKILRVVTLKYQLILAIKNFQGNTVRIAKKVTNILIMKFFRE